MTSVDIELVLVGLLAMLEPATLVTSFLTLVIGRRPLRTGSLFYVGGLGATLAVGVLAAFVLGDGAASLTSSPKRWVSILNLVAGVGILAYVVWSAVHPGDPAKTAANVERIRKLDHASPIAIVAAGVVLANAGIFMVVALKAISQLDPSRLQYVLDWIVFAVVSLLPLGIALALLALAPQHAKPVLARAGAWIAAHGRMIALVVGGLLAVTLLREGVAGLSA